ncbi:Holliday junction branch migration protein RuvA [Mycoplasma suis]|uniref:Holliday junction branch migration complex subunit RuvA n=2 Tax=Mycoplasma suis TaxID=57372 RepID=F0QS44_MYCSL|nr:Holliday junction branch migration protein RuvA [Mycoplasma suis]ADX98314.1 holliday junction ATP-dependent DNA helicase, RuvA [Mycoplasma suis str. Illinois]CBZ40829.1 Holliday junction ATP-dependent DNA helicase RuvA [Mycoplasma suis KI3806]
MYYLKCQIISVHKNYLIAESNGKGYKINFADTYSIKEQEEHLIYVFREFKLDTKNQITSQLFGFLSEKEFELFNSLLAIKGIGCKTAQAILTNDWNMMYFLAEREERLKLAELRGFNLKIANLFIYSIKNMKSLKNSFNKHSSSSYSDSKECKEKEVISSLIKIGYKFDDIKRALDIIRESDTELKNDFNSLINECLKTISQIKYH